MPRRRLAQPEVAYRFVLDEAKFLADIMKERRGIRTLWQSGLISALRDGRRRHRRSLA
jgi:ketol-acid reductoisomerase